MYCSYGTVPLPADSVIGQTIGVLRLVAVSFSIRLFSIGIAHVSFRTASQFQSVCGCGEPGRQGHLCATAPRRDVGRADPRQFNNNASKRRSAWCTACERSARFTLASMSVDRRLIVSSISTRVSEQVNQLLLGSPSKGQAVFFVSRVDSNGVTEHSILIEGRILGAAPDGGPCCATVSLVGSGWVIVREAAS